VEHPLSEYLCYEIEGYVESATGEEISIADRAAHPDLATLGTDFWLFDAESVRAFAILMLYAAPVRASPMRVATSNSTGPRPAPPSPRR